MNTLIRAYRRGAEFYEALSHKAYFSAMRGLAKHGTAIMLVLGIAILGVGLAELSVAQVRVGGNVSFGSSGGPGSITNDYRLAEFAERVLLLVEGNAGAVIMVLAGLAAIVSAAFGAYRMAVSLLVVAVGAFILRSLIGIFFDFTGGDGVNVNVGVSGRI